MEATDAKASPRKDSTEKQPAVEVQRDAVKDKAVLKRPGLRKMVEVMKPSSLFGSRFEVVSFSPPKAAASGPNTVRFPKAANFKALPLIGSSRGPFTPIEKNQKSKLYEWGPTVFDANAKDPYGVADLSHVFPANTLAGSSSSSGPFDQVLGYQFALANPDGALDGGRAIFADPYVAVHGSHARVPADEANDARALADEANNVDD